MGEGEPDPEMWLPRNQRPQWRRKETTLSNEIECMTRDLAMKGYAQSTQKKYLEEAQRLVHRFNKPAGQLSREELRQYVEEVCSRNESASTVNNRLAAILFLFKKTLGQPDRVSFISLRKRSSAVPEVLSLKEVNALFQHITKPAYQVVAMVMYATGMRIEEALALRVEHIDGGRGVIHIPRGKGNKAREAKLSPALYGCLRAYWARIQPPGPYLFASHRTGKPPAECTIRTALKKAAAAAWITKRMTPHVLRHSFATHLLEQGVDIYVVSALLGHSSLQSTRRYARVTRKIIRQTPSPLELLPQYRPPRDEL